MADFIRSLELTHDFRKSYRRLPKNLRALADRKTQWFCQHPFDPRLRTHKLAGKLEGYWAFSVSRSHRILFRFVEQDGAIFFDIGTHSIYR